MDAVQIEWMILADAAQVFDQKLYLLGGGWDTLRTGGTFPHLQHVAVAVALLVPWGETDQRHDVELEFASAAGATLSKIQGQFEVGRPPGIPPGQGQRTQLATDLLLSFPTSGGYLIIARVNGHEVRRLPFTILTTQPHNSAQALP